MFHYTVYLRRTDELVASGTAKECAAQLGMTTASFYDMEKRVRKGKQKKYEILKEPYFEAMKEDKK